jgi:UDP-2-acetamido-2,6-beta-L-arabino-hexul-4-ose reductase
VKILVTGASGFIGRNLLQHLSEQKDLTILTYGHAEPRANLSAAVAECDYIIHLAGVNRNPDTQAFEQGNAGLTRDLCEAVRAQYKNTKKPAGLIYASSIQAAIDNTYGVSKRNAELALKDVGAATGIPVHIYRLPNVFGKWCKPNYNSVVATFCHNVLTGLPLQINSATAPLRLVYVDDVVAEFMAVLRGKAPRRDNDGFALVSPEYATTVGELAEILKAIAEGRKNLTTEDVGTGLKRALYATLMSYVAPSDFAYAIPSHVDPRGGFSEMLKTPASGQFSFFTAHPGVTRGGHYHHTKCEKFLVLRGKARFRFRNIQTGEAHELLTESEKPMVVDTVPGWTHDITNVGEDEMIVMLWASEQFDRSKPDTYTNPL